MSLFISLLALIASLLLPGTCLAMDPLPQAVSPSADPVISASLKGLLDDYITLLPSQNSLNLFGVDGFGTRSWSAHRDELYRACSAAPSSCAPVLRTQIELLNREFQQANPRRGLTLREAVLLSAMTDLCELPFDPQLGYTFYLDRDSRCLDPNMAAMAGVGWRNLGYEHHFLAYADLDQAKRNWLIAAGTLPPEDLERDKGADERDAYAFELRDSLSDAFLQWLVILIKQIALSNYEGAPAAALNAARLAALQGEFERAEEWWQLGRNLLEERPEFKESYKCLLQSQRFSIDVEQAISAVETFDGPQLLQDLIDHKCRFAPQALQYGFLALKKQQAAQALDALKRAQAACERIDVCGYTKKHQLKALIAVAQGQPAILMNEAQYWQSRLKNELLLGTERRIVWALADQLHSVGAGVEAAALYQALDDQLDIFRRQTGGGNQTDMARYDELRRMRVRSALEQGKQLLPRQTEALRGRSLLRRLRSQRLFKELGDESDTAAKTELDRQSAILRAKIKVLEKLPPDAPPAFRSAVLGMLRYFDEIKLFLRDEYLGKLAAKRLKDAWSSPLAALTRYEDLENAAAESPFSSFAELDNNEAYLSWLRVPGGYVGTLIAAQPRDRGPMSLPLRPRLIKQQFISITPQDETMLRLYRDLLMSGSVISRGSIRTSPIEKDKTGLLLNGLPVWQQSDGSFITGKATPVRGRRIQTFGNLSDALFERLLAPFAGYYQDAQRLIISPDGALAYLPFETLTRKGVPVLETIDISYVQSLAVYAELKKHSAAKKRASEPSLLSVADPDYAPPPGDNRSGSGRLRGLEALEWPPLPGSRIESAAIAGLYKNNRQLLGAQAGKKNLDEMQDRKMLKGFQVLHFATHGYVDDERSALVLSSGPGGDSAYLMDQDIVDWDLDSDFALLSACNTGLGRRQKGEGVVGLPYAFFMAGNINTLMSLWPVDDAGTAALMPAFMRRIQQGEDPVAALNNTKRAFARGDYGQDFSNPRVWSAFVMYGAPLTGNDTTNSTP